MWHGLWPEVSEEQVPISHVTNGVHVPSWIAPELYYLFDKYLEYLENDWINRHDEAQVWERLRDIPDDEPWAVRCFTECKRPALIFWDIERLKRIINSEFYPVQIVFAGKYNS